MNRTALLIKGFTYDGNGPEAIFLAGKSGQQPSDEGDITVLPWPADGEEYGYNDGDLPLIQRSFDGSEDLFLELPSGMTVQQLRSEDLCWKMELKRSSFQMAFSLVQTVPY